MADKEKRKGKPRYLRLKRILTWSAIAISLPFLLCSCYFGVWFAGIFHSHNIARGMPIPVYPQSDFLYDTFSGYSARVSKLYCSTDGIETIIAYYEDYASDKKHRHHVSNSMTNESYTISYSESDIFLDFAVWLHEDDYEMGRPSMLIYLTTDRTWLDKEDKCVDGTLIQLVLSVPSP